MPHSKLKLNSLPLYQILQIFSIDILVGAIGTGIFAIKILNVTPPIFWWIIMPLSVWVVYTFDHLIDGYKNKELEYNKRHYFHFLYKKTIILITTLVSISCLVFALLFLPTYIIHLGIYIGIAILVYFILLLFFGSKLKKIFQKEMLIAIIYTIGIWGGPLSQINFLINYQQLIILISFIFVAWVDMVIYAIYEYESDTKGNHISFPRQFGIKISSRIIHIVLFSIIILNMILVCLSLEPVVCVGAFIIILMSTFMFLLQTFQEFFKKHDVYHIIGELTFALPVIILFII